MKLLTHTLVCATVVLVAFCTEISNAETVRLHGQSVFTAEDEKWKDAVPVPSEVLQTLRDLLKASSDDLPAESLLASEVHLGATAEVDLIVMGIGGLRGAHSVPFWVFRKKSNIYQMILNSGGNSLRILSSKWKDHQIIEIRDHSVDTLTRTMFRFNGIRYVQFRQHTEPIR